MTLGIFAVHPFQGDGELGLLVGFDGEILPAQCLLFLLWVGVISSYPELPRQRFGGDDELPAEAAIRIGDAAKRVNRLIVDIKQLHLHAVAADGMSPAVILHTAFKQHELQRVARTVHRPVEEHLGHLAYRVKLVGTQITLALHIQPLILRHQTPIEFVPIFDPFRAKGEKALRIGCGGGHRAVLRVVVVLAALQLHLLPCHRPPCHIVRHIAVHTVFGRRHD